MPGQGGLDVDRLTAHGVVETKAHGGEQQPPAPETLGEKAIVHPFAIAGIPDDGVGDVLHVTPELMAAAGCGRQGHQRIASGGVAVNAKGQLDPQVN